MFAVKSSKVVLRESTIGANSEAGLRCMFACIRDVELLVCCQPWIHLKGAEMFLDMSALLNVSTEARAIRLIDKASVIARRLL